MGGQLLAVDEHPGGVVGGTDVEESAGAGGGVDDDAAPVPDGPLVVEEALVLGVPVAGDGEGGRCVEVVLDAFGGMPGAQVAVEAPGVAGSEDADVAHLVGVDDDVPGPVERDALAREDVGEKGGAVVHDPILADAGDTRAVQRLLTRSVFYS